MACTSFGNCIGDPLRDQGYSVADWSLSNFSIFSINLVLWILHASLWVWIAFQFTKAIYAISVSETDDMYEKFKAGVTNAVFGAIGLFSLLSVRFFLAEPLRLLGIDPTANPFINLPFTP